MTINIHDYDKLKRDVLQRVEEVLELGRWSKGVDIQIHLALEEAPYISYEITEATIFEKEEKKG